MAEQQSGKEQSPASNSGKKSKNSYIAVGLAIGVAIGAAMDAVGLGIALGLCIGVARARPVNPAIESLSSLTKMRQTSAATGLACQ